VALINCPECGHQVSDRAPSCPNCGYPIQQPQPDEPLLPSAPVAASPAQAPVSLRPTSDVVEFLGNGRFTHEPDWRRVIVRFEPERGMMAIGDGKHSMLPATRLDEMTIAADGFGAYEIQRHRGSAKPIEFRPDNDADFSRIAPATSTVAPIEGGSVAAPVYASPPPWSRLRDVSGGFTKTVAGFVFATAVAYALAAALYLAAGNEYADYLDNPLATVEDFTTSAAADGMWLLAWAGMLVAGVLFFVWFNQAYKAAVSRGATDNRWSSGWTIGGWFIPFANFVIPKLVMNEVDRMSHPDNGAPPIGAAWKSRPRLTASDLWWTSWVLASIASVAESLMLESGSSDAVVLYAAVGAGLYAAAGGLLGAVVLTIGGRLRER
jgi:Domain of unknown function (DUF4328)/zinc-ribbon domain